MLHQYHNWVYIFAQIQVQIWKAIISFLALQYIHHPEWYLTLFALVRIMCCLFFFLSVYFYFLFPPCLSLRFGNRNNLTEMPSFWACRKHFLEDSGHTWSCVNPGTVALTVESQYLNCPSPGGWKWGATTPWLSVCKLLTCYAENWINTSPKIISSLSFCRSSRSSENYTFALWSQGDRC